MSSAHLERLEWEDADSDLFVIHADEQDRFATIEIESTEGARLGVYVDEADARALVEWLRKRLSGV